MPLQEPLTVDQEPPTVEEQTRTMLRNHLQAAGGGERDAGASDYAVDTVRMTPGRVHSGKAEIRAFF